MSEGNIENIIKSDRSFAPTFVYHHVLPEINFKGPGSITLENTSETGCV